MIGLSERADIEGKPGSSTGYRRGVHVLGLIALLAAICLVATGCPPGGASEGNAVRTAAEARAYLAAILRGERPTLVLADDASLLARATFHRGENVAAIRRFYDEQPTTEWVCEQIDRLSLANKILTGISPPSEAETIQYVRSTYTGIQESEISTLVRHLQNITSTDAQKLAEQICKL